MTPRSTTSEEVRAGLVEALRLDLIGPINDEAFARELLPEPPTRWYLTGYLSPAGTRLDEPEEELDFGGDRPGATDDSAAPERGPAKRSILPSSMGLSVLVTGETDGLEVVVEWGDYAFEGEGAEEALPSEPPPGGEDPAASGARMLGGVGPKRGWRRTPKVATVVFSLPASGAEPAWAKLAGSDGLEIMTIVRTAPDKGGLPSGTHSVSVFLVNKRREPEKAKYKASVFQARMIVRCVANGEFVARPDLRGGGAQLDRDDAVASVHYRDAYEYAVGHGVSATTDVAADGARRVVTTWLPQAQVERVAAKRLDGVTLGMEDLGRLSDGTEATAALGPLVRQYRDWLKGQAASSASLSAAHQSCAKAMLIDAELAARRIEAGIALLADPVVLDAFRIANRTMGAAARQRLAVEKKVDPATLGQPTWRPFQLAFILMALRGIVDPTHPDRDCVDLLFFPTGGGKTEAYLGLAAFTMVLRRMRAAPGHTLETRGQSFRAPGVSVLMRYTLRLLTLDQLGRAAALMCALELERQALRATLGDWPFEIGLWVGKGATPNRMGDSKNQDPETARKKTIAFNQNAKNPSPIPLEECPWCGTKSLFQNVGIDR